MQEQAEMSEVFGKACLQPTGHCSPRCWFIPHWNMPYKLSQVAKDCPMPRPSPKVAVAPAGGMDFFGIEAKIPLEEANE